MSENFRERFHIKLWYFNGSYGKRMPYLVELYLLQSISFQKTGKELPVSARLCRLCLASQEVMVGIFRIKLLDNVHEQRRYGNCSS